MSNSLTPRQEEIFNFIRKEVQQKNYPPSVREIGIAVGLNSSSTVHSHLAALEKKGFIRRNPTKPRAIEILINDESDVQVNDVINVPVLGQVAAGYPILAEENIEEYFPVPKDLAKEDTVFMLRVKGDSMEKAGILNGDFVIVRQQHTALNNEIVVAMVEDEATVKRFIKEKEYITLMPENDLYEPIKTKYVQILGKVIGVFRKIH